MIKLSINPVDSQVIHEGKSHFDMIEVTAYAIDGNPMKEESDLTEFKNLTEISFNKKVYSVMKRDSKRNNVAYATVKI